MKSNLLQLTLYMKTCCLGKCTDISFIDSTPIRACKNKSIAQNKVFKDFENT
uniref:transposase n=1 Tax=Winogradskyella costae TaxID=2697008 RepID=UPI0037448B2C